MTECAHTSNDIEGEADTNTKKRNVHAEFKECFEHVAEGNH